MPEIQITAVGALVKPEDSDRYRPKARGDRVNVSAEAAERFVRLGTAVLVDPKATARDAEDEQPDGGALPDPEASLAVLRKFANRRRIELRDARNRGMVWEDIQAATNPEEDGEG